MRAEKTIICCCVPRLEDRVRLAKLKNFLEEREDVFEFVGWSRGKTAVVGYKRHLVMTFAKPRLRWMPFAYMAWVALLTSRLVWSTKRRHVVYAVGLESAVPAFFARMLRGSKYIFDNPDNFSSTYGLTGLAKALVDKIEEFIARQSAAHILPDESRVIKSTSRDVFLPNFPSASDIMQARRLLETDENAFVLRVRSNSKFKIFINGRIVEDRGADYFPKVLSRLDKDSFVLVIAGTVAAQAFSDFLAQADFEVLHTERVAPSVSLALCAACDVVLALYAPSRPINLLAQSNKWYDCIAMGTYCITNTEILSTQALQEIENFLFVPYGAEKELVDALMAIGGKRGKAPIPEMNGWDAGIAKILYRVNLG